MNKPFPLDTMYEVTDNQEIYSHHWNKILSTDRQTFTKNNQYKKWYCSGLKKEFLLHRTVALVNNIITIDEFLNPSVKINHKNLNKQDNRPENLEKVTMRGNLLHYHKHKYSVHYLLKNCSIEVLEEALTLKRKEVTNA